MTFNLADFDPKANAGLTIAKFLARQAERNGDKVWLTMLDNDARYSYRDLERITNRLAHGMKSAGIGKGAHVAVMTENRPEQIFTYFALGKVGGVSVPINTHARGHFLEYFAGQSDCTAIVLEQQFLEPLSEVIASLPRITTIILLRDFETGERPTDIPAGLGHYEIVDFDALMSDDASIVDDAEPGDLFQILYTSGTTGRSKGSMYAHSSALHYAQHASGALGIKASDTVLAVFPLFHAGGWLNCIFGATYRSGTAALGRRFSASQYFNQARKSQATIAFMVSVAGFLASQPNSVSDRDHKLRCLIAAPSPPNPLEFEERFGVSLVSGFGISDYGMSHWRTEHAPKSKINTAGQLMPNWDMKIIDDDGWEVPPGEAGELLLRCNVPGGATLGYYNMPEATLETRRDMWFHTGDRCALDADGYLTFRDRKKDSIRRRGENISSVELELALGAHPAVASVAFFPVKATGASTEDEVAVAVVAHGGTELDEEEVLAFCEQRLPKYAVPRYIRLVDAFPFTPNGKIEKYKLRNETEAMLDAVWDREHRVQTA